MRRYLLVLERLFLPQWRQRKFPDPDHPWRRSFTPTYQRKKRLVVWFWYACAAGIVLLSSVAGTVILLLLTTFLSFTVLDETDD